MIAALIFGISALTLLEFFVSYCHSLIAESRGYQLSDQAREISGIAGLAVGGDQFHRILQLTALCPEPGNDRHQVRAVSLYFALLGLARILFGWIVPAASGWIETERGGCAYAAAVILDRRIAHNQILMAQQMGTYL